MIGFQGDESRRAEVEPCKSSCDWSRTSKRQANNVPTKNLLPLGTSGPLLSGNKKFSVDLIHVKQSSPHFTTPSPPKGEIKKSMTVVPESGKPERGSLCAPLAFSIQLPVSLPRRDQSNLHGLNGKPQLPRHITWGTYFSVGYNPTQFNRAAVNSHDGGRPIDVLGAHESQEPCINECEEDALGCQWKYCGFKHRGERPGNLVPEEG